MDDRRWRMIVPVQLQDQSAEPWYKRGYLDGFKDGLKAFAWWRDGVEYVGTCGWTLREAYEALERGDLP